MKRMPVFSISTLMRIMCANTPLWRTIIFKDSFYNFMETHNLFRETVDRCRGGLFHLHLTKCRSDELLDYVTQRCTNISRLCLDSSSMSADVLCEAAKRLPRLIHLRISCYNVSRINSNCVKILDAFGECCHLLESLRINTYCFFWTDERFAMSIARNMPNLRHLQLTGNPLTNKGLEAILDGCTHLESLDLWNCNYLRLEQDSLGERCKDNLRFFRAPRPLKKWGPPALKK